MLKLHRFGTDFSFQSQNVLSLTFRWTAIKVHDDGRYVNVLFCHGSRHQRANIFWPFSTHSRLVSNKTRFNLSSFKQTRWSSPNGALTHKCKQIPRGIVENASYKNSCLNTFANLQLSAFIKRRRLLQICSPLRLVWISLYLSKVSKCLQPICQNKLKTFKDFTSEVAKYQNWAKNIGLTLLYAIDFETIIFFVSILHFWSLMSFQLAIFVQGY